MANDRFYVQLEGFEDLMRDLDNISIKGERAVNKALKAGGKIFLDLALPSINYSRRDSDKHLRDAMAVSRVKVDDAGEKYVSVGTYLGGGRYRNSVYWGHIVEGGHRIVTKSGKVVGYVSAKPFMQPAFERGQDAATKAMGDIIFGAMGLRK
jgi:HK97 gp10 family phage protein